MIPTPAEADVVHGWGVPPKNCVPLLRAQGECLVWVMVASTVQTKVVAQVLHIDRVGLLDTTKEIAGGHVEDVS